MKKNYYRALQIIQEEEYLKAADNDEIKRQKRQFAINFFDDVIDRIPVSRQKRQFTIFGTNPTNFMGTTVGSVDDIIDLYDHKSTARVWRTFENLCPIHLLRSKFLNVIKNI